MFAFFLETIMADALEHDNGTVSVGGRPITNLRFADDIDGLQEEKKNSQTLWNAWTEHLQPALYRSVKKRHN